MKNEAAIYLAYIERMEEAERLEDLQERAGAARMREDLRSCCGPSGAADFVEQVAAG